MDALFDFQTAKAYVQWWKQSEHRAAVALQSRLMLEMLQPLRGKSALVIGCGNEDIARTLLDAGLSVTCIDNSAYLLDIAEQSLGKGMEFLRYDGDDLPFSDNAFHYTTLFCALEFLPDPFKTLEEVFRVTRNRVFIALFNPYATSGFRRQMMRIFPKEKHRAIHAFTCSQLKRAIRTMLGRVPVASCYASFFPESNNWMSRTLDHAACMRHLPFGTFSLLTASVVPRFRTRPLVVNYREAEKRSTAPMPVQMGCDPPRQYPANFDRYPPPESLQDISPLARIMQPSLTRVQPSMMGRKSSHGSDPVSESR
jgi:ubiquinone/menaquinone biosynthesis C-methylase UbiE